DGYIRGVEIINIIERYRSKVAVTVITDLDPSGQEYNATTPYDPDAVAAEKLINLEGRFYMEMDRDNTTGEVTAITITELDKHNLLPEP
ncbi:MAG TPA: hypothetical protein DEG71_03895, partial [Clostridiales bacterium]|nr:hypothetical protein [Clostridiales bacterium]